MNTGQMLITIGAIFLLTTVILNVNRGLMTTTTVMYDSRYHIMGISLATSVIERATGLAFDNESDTTDITSLSQLTLPANLGIESGESVNNPAAFNDFDDFNCYRTIPKADTIRLEGTSNLLIYKTLCQVDYVEADNPEQVSSNRTWHKRIIVRVFSDSMADTVSMSTVFSYWYFR